MEILQVVAGSHPARPLAQDFVVRAALAAPMDFGEIFEKKPRAVKQRQQRSVMIGGKRIKASLDIGEVLLEKDGHIRVEASTVRHGRIGVGAWPRFLTISSSRRLRKPAYGEAVPDIPSDAWQLAGAISDACGKAGERIAHTSLPGSSRATIPAYSGQDELKALTLCRTVSPAVGRPIASELGSEARRCFR